MEKNIEFDTISGMDVSSDRDWNEFLLKSVIKGTGFPANYIDASQEVDFARTVIMQNQMLVRMIVSDQDTLAIPMAKLLKLLYINEFDKNIVDTKEEKENSTNITEIVNALYVLYPKPMTLNLTNINEQINNASQVLDFVTNLYIDEASQDPNISEIKLRFRKDIVKTLIPGLPWQDYDDLYNTVKGELLEEKLTDKAYPKQSTAAGDTGGDDMGGDDFY